MKRYLFLALFCLTFIAAANAGTKMQNVEIEVKDYVPTTTCTVVEKEVPVKVYKNVEKTIVVTEMKLFYEDKEINSKKQVWKEEEYTENVISKELVDETVMKQVCKLVPKEIEKEVVRTVYEEVCDPCSGKKTKCPVEVKGIAKCTVMEKVMMEVPCTVKKCVEKVTPVTKTRKVCVWEPCKTTIKVAVCKPVTATKKVTVCEPQIVMKKVQEKVFKTTFKEVTKKVCKQVEVNTCEDPCTPCKPCDPCAK